MHNDSTDEQTITELQNQVKLVQMDDDELVSRLCLAYLENHDNNAEPQVNEFREYRIEPESCRCANRLISSIRYSRNSLTCGMTLALRQVTGILRTLHPSQRRNKA